MIKKAGEISCPDCEQGWVRKIRIVPLDLEGYLCDECEAFWISKEKISAEDYLDFRNFLMSKGLDYNSTKIENLD